MINLPSNLNSYSAKPNETILEHINNLLNSLKILVDLKYIKDERIIKLIEKSCYYHDFGKANDEFQKRIKDKTLKFDETKEM